MIFVICKTSIEGCDTKGDFGREKMHSLVSESETIAAQWHHLNDGLLAAEEVNQGICIERQFKKCAPVSKQIDEERAKALSRFVEVAPTFSIYLDGLLRFWSYRIVDKT